MRLEQRLRGRHHERRAGREAGDQLGLGGGDRCQRAESLEMDRPHVDDHADVGLRDGHELRDLPGRTHGHLEHDGLGARGRCEDRERQPDLRIEVLRTGHDAQARA